VNKAFTPRVVDGLRPRIEAITEELLDHAHEAGAIDVIADLGFPLPVRVILELLGIPSEDAEQFKRWSRDIAPILDPILMPDQQLRVAAAGEALALYFEDLIAERRRGLGDDLVSELIAAEEAGHKLSPDELRATCVLLLVAGHETTMNLIGNGLHALLRNPEQMSALRRDPSLIKSAVEELLRYDGPVHLTARTALEDVELGEYRIAKGEMAIVALGAANRDPAEFREPERLDIARNPNRHIAFSAGPHFCVGATLARVEAQIVFRKLVERFPNIEMTVDEPEWRETITLRGLKSLPVSL
jgi:cytochrome P450